MLAKQIAIGFGIAVLFPLVVYYGVKTFVPLPSQARFVAQQFTPLPADKAQRKAALQKRRQARRTAKAKQRAARRSASRVFAGYLFVFSIPLALIAILAGSLSKIPAIGAGLIFGGIFALTNCYFQYWPFIANWARFCSLAIAFIALMWVAYRMLAEPTPPKESA